MVVRLSLAAACDPGIPVTPIILPQPAAFAGIADAVDGVVGLRGLGVLLSLLLSVVGAAVGGCAGGLVVSASVDDAELSGENDLVPMASVDEADADGLWPSA